LAGDVKDRTDVASRMNRHPIPIAIEKSEARPHEH